MKKCELMKKLSFAGAIILSAVAMTACNNGMNSATTAANDAGAAIYAEGFVKAVMGQHC